MTAADILQAAVSTLRAEVGDLGPYAPTPATDRLWTRDALERVDRGWEIPRGSLARDPEHDTHPDSFDLRSVFVGEQ